MQAYLYEFTNNAIIEPIFKNNGKRQWPKNTKLIYDNNSFITGNPNSIILKQEMHGEQTKYTINTINFSNLENSPPGEYFSYLCFSVNGMIIGEKLNLRINIRKNLDKYIKCIKEINEFWKDFSLNKVDDSDEKILEVLSKWSFFLSKSFWIIILINKIN